MNRGRLLQEANRLVSCNDLESAIRLLKANLHEFPDDYLVLQALGRACLANKQPEMAVKYLRLALALQQGVVPSNVVQSEFVIEEVGDDDLGYWAEQENEFREEEYSYYASSDAGHKGGDVLNENENKNNDYSFETIGEVARTCDSSSDESSNTIEHAVDVALLESVEMENGVSRLNDDEETPFAEDQDDYVNDGEYFDIDDGEQENEESDYSENYSLIIDADDLNVDDEFDWLENVEDLEDFDDSPVVGEFNHALNDDRVTQEQRARQIAVEVIEHVGWDRRSLNLLEEVFVCSGNWSATRTALIRLIDELDVVPEQILVAHEVREYWQQSEYLWTTFHKIKTNAPFFQADAAYRHFSWLEAIKIQSLFWRIPSSEEIVVMIEDLYLEWYTSNYLRRVFQSFFKYLKFRTSKIPRCLPPSMQESFGDPVFAMLGVDAGEMKYPGWPVVAELSQLGVQLNRWPRPDEYTIKINKELMDESK